MHPIIMPLLFFCALTKDEILFQGVVYA